MPIRSSPSNLQLTPYGYYFRYSIPPDMRPVFGKTELKYSLRTAKLKNAKYRSRMMVTMLQLLINDIRKDCQMTELSTDQINNLVRKYFKQALESDEDWRVYRKPLDDDRLDDQIEVTGNFKSQAQEDLAKSNYHNVSKDVEELLAENNLDVNRQTEGFKILCRELLKAQVKLYGMVENRELGNYDSETALGSPTASPSKR